ncbi:MAG TPA: M12 family metallopeptidase [Myxococcaceae bacterium]|nr:M12 family metallopeptidase [Myxococcaceae bacterium]
MDTLKVCIDQVGRFPENVAGRLVLDRGTLWREPDDDSPEPVELEVGFLEGDPGLRREILAVASEWSRHANVAFLPSARRVEECEIRISFGLPGSWSYVGKDRVGVTPQQPTMNFGWLTPRSSQEEIRRVVLHEFGHALGCVHEHFHPRGGVPWNKEAVYAWYWTHRRWDRKQVDEQVLYRYDRTLTVHSKFDPASIMIYPIPPEHTDGRFQVGLNLDLSATDKAFIGKTYPRP